MGILKSKAMLVLLSILLACGSLSIGCTSSKDDSSTSDDDTSADDDDNTADDDDATADDDDATADDDDSTADDDDDADTTAPAVNSTVPVSDATGVAIDGNLAATFSEAMDPSTITASTFTLKSPSNAATRLILPSRGSPCQVTPLPAKASAMATAGKILGAPAIGPEKIMS